MTDLAAAVEAIAGGGVVGMPTDTVYGLAADPHQPDAVEAVFELKERDRSSPLVVLAATLVEAEEWGTFTGRARQDAARHWPGALTVIVPARRPLPDGVGNPATGSIGLRVPDHSAALELLAATGPLAVTSANLSGQPPAMSDHEARAVFGDRVAVYVEGVCPGPGASTVVDYTGEEPVILRQGPVLL